MAGRFPDAADHEKFWDLLEAGLDVHRRIPSDRFDVEKHYDPNGKVRNTSHTPYGCFIQEPGLFDPRFFNMSPREAAQTDPMQRLALATAYEALEMAGYVPNRTPSTQQDRIGTFYGQTSDDWREVNAAQDIDTYFITGGVRPFGPKVMRDAGLDPHDVDYVEMHGTGTQANVGHGEAASGVTAFIKSLMMMQKGTIPPHCGIKGKINHGFPKDLDARNVHIALKPTPFHTKDGGPRRVFVNNFSAAGGNTATLLEEAPLKQSPRVDPRGEWVLAVSAKSKAALRANTQNLIKYIAQNPDVTIPDLSYTTTARRIQHNYRIAFSCGNDLSKIVELLNTQLEHDISPVPGSKPRIAFSYTGQGSHYTALSKALYEYFQSYKDDIQTLDNVSKGFGYPSLLPLIEGKDENGEAVDAKDLSPLVVQLGLNSIQIALTRFWDSLGVKPDVVIGHSLGEYAALNAAGVLSIEDTIYLVGERAKLLLEKCTPGSHAMLACKVSAVSLQGILEEAGRVEIACLNGPQETVLGGTVQDIDEFAEKLGKQGIKSTKLRTPFAFHTSQVDPIMESFELLAGNVTFLKAKVPVVSPLLSSVLNGDNTIDAKYLARHAREPVNFVGGLSFAKQFGLVNDQTAWVELGPHPVCTSFVKSTFGAETLTAPTMRRDVNPYRTIAESLSALHLVGIAIDWNQYHAAFADCVRVLDLPAYAFDNKNYWIQYTGDWNLSKGSVTHKPALPEPTSSMTTTSVQKLVSENVDSHSATVIIESDTAQPQLRAAVQGHMVNGTALCPSSLYADMAMTVGQHLHELLQPGADGILPDVGDMEVFKPFIVDEDISKSQTIRLSGTFSAGDDKATLLFSSGSGKAEVQHAKCYVKYGHGIEWANKWQRQTYLIGERIDRLKRLESTGQAHRMLRGIAYRLFGSFVEYDRKYQGMEDVILDSPELEATAKISFQTRDEDGKFFCSPYWIDSVCHLAGFIVNANETIDSSKQVYVSHGWESMRFAEPLRAEKTYRSYVKMQPLDNNIMAGDVYIFDGDRIIGLCEQLKFQCIPRALLNTFLPPRGAAVQKQVAQPAPKAAPKAAAVRGTKKAINKSTVSTNPTVSVTNQVLEIIAAEVGMPTDELADAIVFTNIGVDSLMSLTISGRIREELDINIDQEVFADHPTIGEFKAYLSQFEKATTPVLVVEEDESTTASLSSSSSSSDFDDASSTPGSVSTPISHPGSPANSSDLSTLVRKTISEGMEVDVDELLSIEDLSTIGMDSLMALTMLGTLREQAGLALPSDFFVENHSIKAIEQALHITPPESALKKKPQPKKSGAASKSQPQTRPTTQPSTRPSSRPSTPLSTARPTTSRTKKVQLPDRQATSLLLQGSPKTATKEFWLVPDGGGAPTSYTFMDTISPMLCIWGLTSPFCRTPEEFIIGVVGIATKYVTEIKRRQPSGPYHIGGWSAGGVISYEIVQQLIALGDAVDTLVFIDTPCPLIIEPLPSSLHRFFGSIGLLGDGDGALDKLPPWLLPHFAQSVTALSTYDACPLPGGKSPNVWAMWCEDGVCKTPEDRRPDPYPYGHAEWLLENRTDFGANLWEEFIDEGKLVTAHMEGNHFSMMKPPCVGRLVEFLRKALA
ncbi:Type I Iterative PKS [Bacidia gigantensis]|uniref:Type I Iterative PKS n=1 Tax=Bacidia gigantensis TaxID=2732470 RepID=UPI001D04079D|nr:Type I Iterative PKS [Bacidia gigantensis]KAG8525619.1 Type I Iterative PKS [Bacidia gigantensis]